MRDFKVPPRGKKGGSKRTTEGEREWNWGKRKRGQAVTG